MHQKVSKSLPPTEQEALLLQRNRATRYVSWTTLCPGKK